MTVKLLCCEPFPEHIPDADPQPRCNRPMGHRGLHRIEVPIARLGVDIYGYEIEWPIPRLPSPGGDREGTP